MHDEAMRKIISERTKIGVAKARAAGVQIGRVSPKLVADAGAVVELWRIQMGGVGLRDLARKLGGVSTATAARLARLAKETKQP